MKRMAVAGGAVLASMMAWGSASGQTAERCALIGPATERLACYDSLFRSEQFTGGEEGGEAPDTGIWTSGVEISQIDGVETAFATLQSEQLIPALPRGRAPARLSILCVNEALRVQFGFAGHPMGTETSNSGTITLQFDRNPPRSRSLQLGGDRTTLGFFSDADTLEFIDQLSQTERLFVRAQPLGQRSVTVSFTIEGVTEALAPVREACGF